MQPGKKVMAAVTGILTKSMWADLYETSHPSLEFVPNPIPELQLFSDPIFEVIFL